MSKCQLIKSDEKYSAVFFIKTSDSPFDTLKEMECLLNTENIEGIILIDELLHSGNTEERFIQAEFKNKSFDMSSFNFVVLPKKDRNRTWICEWLRSDPDNLEYTDLTREQRNLILHGFNI
jgi:hypothetical protein